MTYYYVTPSIPCKLHIRKPEIKDLSQNNLFELLAVSIYRPPPGNEIFLDIIDRLL
ncbi:hypothetical protein HHI36_021739, partial [Cryptolaemus montrouzieri]